MCTGIRDNQGSVLPVFTVYLYELRASNFKSHFLDTFVFAVLVDLCVADDTDQLDCMVLSGVRQTVLYSLHFLWHQD